MPPVQAASLSDVSVVFVEVVLPVLGVLLLVMTFAMVLFKFGEPYKDHIQHIQAFGVDLRISIVTLFVLVAVALSLTGACFLYRNYEQQLASLRDMPKRLEDAEKSYKLALAQAKQIDVVALVTLGDTDPKHTPPPEGTFALSLTKSAQRLQVRVDSITLRSAGPRGGAIWEFDITANGQQALHMSGRSYSLSGKRPRSVSVGLSGGTTLPDGPAIIEIEGRH